MTFLFDNKSTVQTMHYGRSVFDLYDAIRNKHEVGILFHCERSDASLEMHSVFCEMETHVPDVYLMVCRVRDLEHSRKYVGVTVAPVLWVIREGSVVKIVEGCDAKAYWTCRTAWKSEECPPSIINEEDLYRKLREGMGAAEAAAREYMENKPLILARSNYQCALSAPKAIPVEREVEPELFAGIQSIVGLPDGEDAVIIDGKTFFTTPEEVAANRDLIIRKGLENDEAMKRRYENLIRSADVFLFMKGTKENPYCRFSRMMVTLLNREKINFEYFNVIHDHWFREKLKELTGWPTFPLLYVRGKRIGGIDVITEMLDKGRPKTLRDSLQIYN